MTHSELILKLGGSCNLAHAIGHAPTNVWKWSVRGIPSRYWHLVIDVAKAQGMDVTAQALAESKPPTTNKVEAS